MQIDNSFAVQASPAQVYEFLLDVNRVVGCVPGAQLSEVVDPDTFRGKVRIKVGPVTVNYQGIARVTNRDATKRSATLEAEGRETTGSGSARATTTMSVVEAGAGSTVTFSTDFTVVGRIAQFGRGIIEDVSRHLVNQMASCIQAKLERGEDNPEVTGTPAAAPADSAGSPVPAGSAASAGSAARAASAAVPATTPIAPGEAGLPRVTLEDGEVSAPLDAFALVRAVGRERLRKLSRSPAGLAAVAGAAAVVVAVVVWRIRRR
ncbi:MAG TPA: SRPBCC family protein [Candidatus Binatia bacterium]|nr:SRPBCC family protein [Candidatus Binatia bacterium]